MRLKKIGDELQITLEGADEIQAHRSRLTGDPLGSTRIAQLSIDMAKQLINFLDNDWVDKNCGTCNFEENDPYQNPDHPCRSCFGITNWAPIIKKMPTQECSNHQPLVCNDGSRFCMYCGRRM